MRTRTDRKNVWKRNDVAVEMIISAVCTMILGYCLFHLIIQVVSAEGNILSQTLQQAAPVISAFAS